jgi:hypothetical protein
MGLFFTRPRSKPGPVEEWPPVPSTSLLLLSMREEENPY